MAILSFQACNNDHSFSARGTVQGIEYGKDGYTAQLKGADGKAFDAVISRVKMQNAYRELKSGEEVELFGDTLHLDGKVRVLVKEIK
jgi:hypothetical protein